MHFSSSFIFDYTQNNHNVLLFFFELNNSSHLYIIYTHICVYTHIYIEFMEVKIYKKYNQMSIFEKISFFIKNQIKKIL
jgi:hypothetical protein